MSDPYKILGTTPSATDDEVKKAYRTQCKRFHPDLNPNDPTAEARFKEVQAAYDQVMKMRQGGGGPYGAGGYTSQQQGGQGNYGYGGFSYDPFSGFGGFGDFFAGGFSSNPYQQSEPVEMQAARNYLNNRRYREALNALSAVPESARTARWYYYSALANAGLGNTITAQQNARQAARMDPGNPQYQRVVDQLDGQSQQYQARSSSYRAPTFSLWQSFCLPTLVLNLICRLCCCF